MHTTIVTPATLARHLDDPDWAVLDIRHDLMRPGHWGEERYRDGHIAGAVFLHLDRDLSAAKTGVNGRHPLPEPQAAAATFARAGVGPSTQVVVYDEDSGMYAARAWWMLRWLGHRAVALLDGGYARWVREAHPVSTAIPVPRAAPLSVGRVAPIADAGELLASLSHRSLAIVDARAPERFRGETEPMDPVAGRIPGARNRPYASNLAADGTFKDPATLRREFEALLGDTPVEEVVHHCGSGVTACHNVLAMLMAGYPETRVYPGSWSEWCADPSRPVATGPA
ncbi:MAG: sulfurtransferase [Betaproteobacteria bacterium]